ncbi:MAG TPA: hypothetical protein VGC65_01250 [Bacteroidia bacterium]|jgi:hypothetical protein
MSILQKIFFKISSTAKDIEETFDPLLLENQYKKSRFFSNSERHIKYEKGNVQFDFLWNDGHRPVLFLSKNGSNVKTTIYQNLVKKHAPPNAPIGQVSFFIYTKLDKDKYYNEYAEFISEYIKSA